MDNVKKPKSKNRLSRNFYRLVSFCLGRENNKIFRSYYARIVKLMQIKGNFNRLFMFF